MSEATHPRRGDNEIVEIIRKMLAELEAARDLLVNLNSACGGRCEQP